MSSLKDFSIRKAVMSDLEALVGLEKQCFDPDLCFCRRQIRRLIAKVCTMVAIDEAGQIVAQVSFLRRLSPSACVSVRLYSLAVAPQVRGRGVARTILSEALQHFVDKQTIRVSLEVEAGNPVARLYRSVGFKEEKILPHYYGQNRDGVRMVIDKTLGSSVPEIFA